jgi:dihydrolipoamide dehydrogenase
MPAHHPRPSPGKEASSVAEPQTRAPADASAAGDSASHFDVLVIGAGTGGYPTAIRAAQLGLRTAIIEREKVGGLCLHRGCIPTKALLQSALALSTIRRAAEHGIQTGDVSFDYATMQARKDKIVGQLHRGVESLFKKYKVTQLNGTAQVAGPREVQYTPADGGAAQRLTCNHLVLATGADSRPLDGLPFDGQRVLNTDQLLALPAVPASVLVVGSGAWNTEWAFLLATLGAQVTLVEPGAHQLPGFDPEVGKQLERLVGRKLLKAQTGTTLNAGDFEQQGEGLRVRLGKDKTVDVACALIGTGSTARTGAGVDGLGLKLADGFVAADEFGRTNVDGVYAIGDLIGGLMLAHEAMLEGITVAETIAGRRPLPVDRTRIPRMAYTWPECASIGLTEEAAKARGGGAKTAKFPYSANARAQTHAEATGFVKVVAADDGQVLGVHIIGPNASELIGTPAVAQLMQAVAWEVGAASFPHPTVSEAIWEAARMIDGAQIHL